MAKEMIAMKIDKDVVLALREYRAQTGVSMQYAIRKAVEKYIAENPPKK